MAPSCSMLKPDTKLGMISNKVLLVFLFSSALGGHSGEGIQYAESLTACCNRMPEGGNKESKLGPVSHFPGQAAHTDSFL